MTMQWFTPRAPTDYVSQSSDGYYAVSMEQLQGDGNHRMTRYSAWHIEALWARPLLLGGGMTVGDAQQICEQHRAQLRTQ